MDKKKFIADANYRLNFTVNLGQAIHMILQFQPDARGDKRLGQLSHNWAYTAERRGPNPQFSRTKILLNYLNHAKYLG